MDTIKKMPSDSRLWVYQSSKLLTDTDVDKLMQQGKSFVESWTAHGAALKASFDIVYKRFIVIAVDEKQAQASGCSIDKSLAFIQSIEQEYGL
ncbi:MAG TPA: ABC transporter ATPase, partial [Bacteroidia bacterium]|nr:ABC transporter ATPase [Bacteroidia bacterium]